MAGSYWEEICPSTQNFSFNKKANLDSYIPRDTSSNHFHKPYHHIETNWAFVSTVVPELQKEKLQLTYLFDFLTTYFFQNIEKIPRLIADLGGFQFQIKVNPLFQSSLQLVECRAFHILTVCSCRKFGSSFQT